MHIFYGIFAIVAGVGLVIYSAQVYKMFGPLELAEKYLGVTGTNTFWKLFGLLAIFGGFWELVKG